MARITLLPQGLCKGKHTSAAETAPSSVAQRVARLSDCSGVAACSAHGTLGPSDRRKLKGAVEVTIRRTVATMSAHCILEGGSIHKYSPFLMHLVNSWYKEMREATTSATVSTMVEGIELPALAVTSSGQIVPSWTSEPK